MGILVGRVTGRPYAAEQDVREEYTDIWLADRSFVRLDAWM